MDIGWELLIELGLLGKSCTLKTNYTPCEEGFTCVPCMMRQGCKSFEGECYPCVSGDLCPAGSVNEYAWTKKHACPPGMICPNRTAAEPCKEGWFCPLGSFTYLDVLECNVSGTYCPEGSEVPTNACPKGFYCPTPKQKFSCPKGHYCKAFSVEPFKCDFGTLCPAGSEAPGVSVLGLVMLLLVMLSALGLLKYGERKIVEQQLKKQKETNRLVAMKNNKKTILSSLLGVETSTLAEEVPGFDRCARPITIQFLELGLTVGSKALLQNVSGAFKYGKLVAVMGPSGCGKSTLLNTLCGKATYGKRVGRVLFNTKQREITAYRQVIGFVPQDDTVFPQLTVEENLFWSANLRLPVEMSTDPARLSAIIEGAIQLLNLDRIQSSVVGDVKRRGISGGQKKRVNIGVELVSDPTVLFMDEPTSGLSAGDTLIVMKACRSMALMDRSIVCIIHQPRYSVFTLFHDMMLLNKGQIVYFGESERTLEYFMRLGFMPPPNENVADFFMDCIGGQVGNQVNKKFSTEDFFSVWKEEEHRRFLAEQRQAAREKSEAGSPTARDGGSLSSPTAREGGSLSSPSGATPARKASSGVDLQVELPESFVRQIKENWDLADRDGTGELDAEEMGFILEEFGIDVDEQGLKDLVDVFDEDGTGNIDFEEFLEHARLQYALLQTRPRANEDQKMHDATQVHYGRRRVKGFAYQLWHFFTRSCLQWYRSDTENLIDVSLLLVATTVVGLVLGSDWSYGDIPNNACLSTVTLGVLSSVSALKHLGDERVLFQRERAVGVDCTAYFCAKLLIVLLEDTARAVIFTGIYHNFLVPKTGFGTYVMMMMLVSFACSGVGFFISTIMHPTEALLAAVIYPLVTGVFLSGTNPTLEEMSPFMYSISGISFTRWATEGLTVLEMQQEEEHNDFRIELLYDKIGFDEANLTSCYVGLIVLGCAYRILAYMTLMEMFKAPATALRLSGKWIGREIFGWQEETVRQVGSNFAGPDSVEKDTLKESSTEPPESPRTPTSSSATGEHKTPPSEPLKATPRTTPGKPPKKESEHPTDGPSQQRLESTLGRLRNMKYGGKEHHGNNGAEQSMLANTILEEDETPTPSSKPSPTPAGFDRQTSLLALIDTPPSRQTQHSLEHNKSLLALLEDDHVAPASPDLNQE